MPTLRRILVQSSIYLATLLVFVSVAHAQSATSLQNPLSSQYSSIPNFIAGFLKVLVMIALPIITVFFVYAGFLFVTARGNKEGLVKARDNFVYVVMGSILILGAWVLATLISGTVSQLTG